MRTLSTYLPGLICAGGMLLCMGMMRRGSKKGESCHGSSQQSTGTEELAALREELTTLRAQVRLDRQDARRA